MDRRAQRGAVAGVTTEGVRRSRRSRAPGRRDELLAASLRLFHERGYHSTSLDDIGEAVGLTGPAVYRHFRSKDQILATLLVGCSELALESARTLEREIGDPTDRLGQIAGLYVDVLVENRALTSLTLYERRTMGVEFRAEIERQEQQVLEVWVRALRAARPEMSLNEARLRAHSAGVLAMGAVAAPLRFGGAERSRVIKEMMMSVFVPGEPEGESR
jgi:AcrR family transcriptional regulator